MCLASSEQIAKASRARSRYTPEEKTEVRAIIHRKDVILKFKGRRVGPGGDTTRGIIRGFTHQSRRRLSFLVRNTADLFDGFVTLTYPASFPSNGREVKRHLSTFCSWLRRRKIAYVWILEFQQRGAPHFHFLIRGFLPKEDIAQRWFEIVGSLDQRHLRAGTRVEGVKNQDQVGAYMAAYMTKLEQKQVPKSYKSVGRFWGASRLLTKTMHKAGEVYRDASRAIRAARKWYEARNRSLKRPCMRPEGHAGPCGLKAEKGAARCTRPVACGFRWKWLGHGFILMGGASIFKAIIRQAALIDSGADLWKDWDGTPGERQRWLPPYERETAGQLLLDGGIEKMSDLKWGDEK